MCRECGYRILYKKRTKRSERGSESSFLLFALGSALPDFAGAVPFCFSDGLACKRPLAVVQYEAR